MICRDEIIRLSLGNSNNQFVSAIFDYLKENVKGELIPNYRSNNKGFDILWKLGSNKKVWLMIRPLISQRINDIHPRKIEKIFTTIKHYNIAKNDTCIICYVFGGEFPDFSSHGGSRVFNSNQQSFSQKLVKLKDYLNSFPNMPERWVGKLYTTSSFMTFIDSLSVYTEEETIEKLRKNEKQTKEFKVI